jgi:hypothetical protein
MAGWRNRQRANSGIPSDDLYIAPWSRVERLVKHDVTSWASVGAPRPRDFHANIAYESLAPGRSVTRPNWRRIGSSTAPCACPTQRARWKADPEVGLNFAIRSETYVCFG